jgi:hypothetical protein
LLASVDQQILNEFSRSQLTTIREMIEVVDHSQRQIVSHPGSGGFERGDGTGEGGNMSVRRTAATAPAALLIAALLLSATLVILVTAALL